MKPALVKEIPKTIRSGSYSKLTDFEQCPLKAKLKHVDRIPEEKAPAAERGTMIHDLAENFVRGNINTLPKELAKFSDEFLSLRTQFSSGNVSLEGEWGFDKDWNVTEYKTAWLRMKLDARAHVSKTKAVVVDYKTGKRFGNELKHGEQTLLYGIAEVLREPQIEEVTVELWYLDVDELHAQTFTRDKILKYLPVFEKRLKALTTATKFPPRPNIFSCKYCPFGPAKGGQCQYGVLPGDTNISQYRRRFG
jgi:hypothetical protein